MKASDCKKNTLLQFETSLEKEERVYFLLIKLEGTGLFLAFHAVYAYFRPFLVFSSNLKKNISTHSNFEKHLKI